MSDQACEGRRNYAIGGGAAPHVLSEPTAGATVQLARPESLTLLLGHAARLDQVASVVRAVARSLIGCDAITFVVRNGDQCHYVEEDAIASTFVKSMAMVPVGRSNAVAAIGAYWANSHEATQSELEMLEAMADSAGMALGV